jgi:hypothetical protein
MIQIQDKSLSDERDALLADLYTHFSSVTREGGVSWAESVVIDDWGSESECAAARARDTDTSWMQLVEDENWSGWTGCGGFSFLDDIGFRYYAAAAIVRSLRTLEDCGILFSLNRTRMDKLANRQFARFSDIQSACVARFLRFMVKVHQTRDHDDEHLVNDYREAFDVRWGSFLPADPPSA